MGGESCAEQSQVVLATPKSLCQAWAGLSSLVGGECLQAPRTVNLAAVRFVKPSLRLSFHLGFELETSS